MTNKVFLLETPLTWSATTNFTLGSRISSNSDLFLQQVTTPGISGGSTPSFSTTTGQTTIDGTVVWTCVGPTSSPVWLVPPDWDNAQNSIECIGAGSAGDSNAPGGGGGGGAYSKITTLTLTPGTSIPYSVGQAFFNHTVPGGDSWFNGASLAASSVGAKGGGTTSTVTGGPGGSASSGIGTTRTSGGAGGNGQGTVFAGSGGGGGGAGGPSGGGVTGTNGDPTSGAGGGGGQADFGGTLPGGGGGGGTNVTSPGSAGGAGQEFQVASVFPLVPAYGCGGGAGGAGFGGTGGTNGLGGNYGGGGGGASATAGQNAGADGLIVITYTQLPQVPPAWLVVNEPATGSPATGGGYTDRSSYLFLGQGAQHSFNLQTRQRGNATYTLVSDPEDPTSAPANYLPTLFQPIYLFDQDNPATNWPGAPTGWALVFAGLLQDFTVRYVGTTGLRYIDCTAVSLEAVFNTIYCDGQDFFVNETCEFIFTALFNKYENGAPVTLGTVSAGGVVIPQFNPQLGQKISQIYQQLATTCQGTWGVDPQTQQAYLVNPLITAPAAPFSITSTQALWDTISDRTDGADYRNRQGVKLSDTAFPMLGEVFIGSGQQSLTLMRPVRQVVKAYATLNLPNFADLNFTGNPSPGDTFAIGPNNQGWTIHQGLNPWVLDTVIVVGGYIFLCTTGGASAATQNPLFLTQTVVGDTVTDGSAIWTCQGSYTTGNGGLITWTFVAALDNTQPFQVLIGASQAASVQNAVDAINNAAPYGGTPPTAGRGLTFSLPTWENGQVNAAYVSSAQIKVTNIQDSAPGISALTSTSANFSWSSTQTQGGSFPQGSLGPNEGATIEIQVYPQGTSTASPGLSYTEGSANIGLATPLNAGSQLNVYYYRADSGVVQVEDTALVTALAITSHGTGKIQRLTDQSTTGLISTSALAGLQFAQQALEAYETPPVEIEVQLHQPGLLPGQVLTVALTTGPQVSLNGMYFIEEVRAQTIPGVTKSFGIDNPNAIGAGHYRYTAKLIDVAQIASYMDFWEGLGGGSSGGGSGSLAATSGGSTPTSGQNNTGGVNEQSGNYAAVAGDSGKLISFSATATLTLPNPPPSPQWNIFAQCIASGGVLSFAVTGGQTIDGLAANRLKLAQLQGCYITTDGTNYFTARPVPLGQAAIETGNVTLSGNGNAGKLLSFNSSSAQTLMLQSTPAFSSWVIFVQCTGTGGLTINPNGLDIDGSGSSLVLTQGQGVIIFTDGTNYFTVRGIGGSTSPGGSSPQVQFNNSGAFGGITGATSDGTSLLVTTQASGDSSTKAASTAFVAAALSGVNPAVAVQAATTAAGDTSGFTYNNGAFGIGATFTGSVNTAITIDGFTFTAVGQRLLVKNDTQSPSGAFNGVYYVTQIQTSLLAPILTRALDYDQPSDINNTGAIPVINGTVNGSTSWVLTSQVTTVGTSPLTYAQFSYNPSTLVQTSRNINTTSPLAGGGNLSADLTLSVGKASSSVFGVVEVDGTTITASGGVISASAGGVAPAMVRIAQSVLGSPAASVTFSSIPGTYTNLKITITARSATSALVDTVTMVVNTDTAAHYSTLEVAGFTGSSNAGVTSNISVVPATATIGAISAATATANCAGIITGEIADYAGTTFFKQGVFTGGFREVTVVLADLFYWDWASTSAINQLVFSLASGANFAAGSVFTLYGIT